MSTEFEKGYDTEVWRLDYFELGEPQGEQLSSPPIFDARPELIVRAEIEADTSLEQQGMKRVSSLIFTQGRYRERIGRTDYTVFMAVRNGELDVY